MSMTQSGQKMANSNVHWIGGKQLSEMKLTALSKNLVMCHFEKKKKSSE